MKYQVKIQEVYKTIITVEADSEQEAQAKAEEILAAGRMPDDDSELPEAVYDYTLERSEWPVWEA